LSKKLYSSAKYKQLLHKRTLKQAQRRHRKLKKPSARPTSRKNKIAFKRKWKRICAPDNFSMIDNAMETTRFLNRIIESCQLFNFNVDLRQVKSMSHESPALLLAHIKKAHGKGARFKGSFPFNEKPRKVFEESGIFDFLRSGSEISSKSNGRIVFRENTQILNQVASDLCRLASEKVLGKPKAIPACYGILLDLMSNTHNHARLDDEGTEMWWAMVSTDAEQKKAFFTFIDMGLGIFETLPKRRALWYKTYSTQPRTETLRMLLDGGLDSRTGKSNRGYGIPRLLTRLRQGAITELRIVSNDVQADVRSGRLEMMGINFSGTLIYWEVSL